MSSLFSRLLPQNPDAKSDLGRTLGRAKSINEFLGDVVDAFKDTDLPAAIVQAVPWAEPLGEALSEAVPPVRFVVKLFESLAKVHEPGDLGYLACTLAYQQAIQQAVPVLLNSAKRAGEKAVRSKLREATPAESYDFTQFSFDEAVSHPFVRDADGFLEQFVTDLGHDDKTFRKLQHEVHVRFVPNLKILLSHGKTRERFAPFSELLTLRTDEARAYDALLRHADYQRWLYEERPVLGQEPFALQHVYIDTDCGQLRWSEVDEGARMGRSEEQNRVDPFAESSGGRQPLVQTVLELLADLEFDDAIVIQGPAGCGKSSFTLRLCSVLQQQGLRPIRIELKNLDTRETTAIAEALPEAVELSDREHAPDAQRFFGTNLFLDNQIFEEHVTFGKAKICPYVLILDGWDEISVSASEGYQQQVERLLRDVRQTFLERRSFPVRVILAGRPTDAVARSGFLRGDTVILTVRPLAPQQLEKFVNRVRAALVERPLDFENSSRWSLEQVAGLAEVLEKYREGFEETAEQLHPPDPDRSMSFDVLGLPLLTILSLRLMAEWPGILSQLVENTTTLYRSLVDLVIGKGGKPKEADFEPEERATLTGRNLRTLLRATAEAMTALGTESISQDELEVRLDLEGQNLDEKIKELGAKRVLSRLMISFFFKGGHRELGCEFSHKSFREYLFAEQVVETLKAYGRQVHQDLPERPAKEYWKDFEDSDPRRDLSRCLEEMLGPNWITREVADHLSQLIRWEIARAAGDDPYPAVGDPTDPCTLEEWERIRDALADLWDWWGEGVHLRSQPRRKPRSKEIEYLDPSALEIARDDRPRARPHEIIPPVRLVTIDAHLGDALFQISTEVHFEIAVRRGWLEEFQQSSVLSAWKECTPAAQGPRRYQASIKSGNREWTVFSPSGRHVQYFWNYAARINACGFRPFGPFPNRVSCRGVDLRGAVLQQMWLERTEFYYANLTSSLLSGASLYYADFSRASLPNANLDRAFMQGANFFEANISGSFMSNALLPESNLANTILEEADISYSILQRAVISGANFSSASLRNADLSNADLSGADLSGADLSGADLSGADLSGVNLIGIDLSDVDLSKARNVQLAKKR